MESLRTRPRGHPRNPRGGDDEYRSVVFDETFVRAARLQEFSAQERITDHTPAVRRLPPARRGGLSRQALVLVLLIAVAFGTAVYMGVRHPYRTPAAERPAEPLRMTVVPLAPESPVPGARDVEQLYAHSPAAHFRRRRGRPPPADPPHRELHRRPGGVRAAHRPGLRRTLRPGPGRGHRRRDPRRAGAARLRPAGTVRREHRPPRRRRTPRGHRLACPLRPRPRTARRPGHPGPGHPPGRRDRLRDAGGHHRPHRRLRAPSRRRGPGRGGVAVHGPPRAALPLRP